MSSDGLVRRQVCSSPAPAGDGPAPSIQLAASKPDSFRAERFPSFLQPLVTQQAPFFRSRLSQPEFDIANLLEAWLNVHPTRAGTPVLHTPVVSSPLLADWLGVQEVLVKDDSKQIDGSFKIRGAINFLAWHIRRGLKASKTATVAASHGNHAQGVVRASNHFGFKETLLVMPLAPETQLTKIKSCLKQGAVVFLYGPHFAASSEKAQAIVDHGLAEEIPEHTLFLPACADSRDIADAIGAGIPVILYGNPDLPRPRDADDQLVRAKVKNFSQKVLLVPTYNDVRTSLGQGTDMLDLLNQRPELLVSAFTYVVGAGGGGKIAGDATVLSLLNPSAVVFGVNSTLVPVLKRSLQKGFLDIDSAEFDQAERDNRAEGTGVPNPGLIPFEQMKKLNVQVDLVDPVEIDEALVFADSQPWYGERNHRIEGAAAAVLAAVLGGAVANAAGSRLVLSITGRNIDEATLQKAYETKGWVAESPEFYRLVCGLRRRIRKGAGEKTVTRLGTLNALLADPVRRRAMMEGKKTGILSLLGGHFKLGNHSNLTTWLPSSPVVRVMLPRLVP